MNFNAPRRTSLELLSILQGLIFTVRINVDRHQVKYPGYSHVDVFSTEKGSPFVRNMPSTLTAVAGKSFYIKCPVAGYPITSITWEKDEQLLPSTIRQTVSQNGTLTIRDIDRAVDSGWYTCTATNKQGSSNKRGVHINVVGMDHTLTSLI